MQVNMIAAPHSEAEVEFIEMLCKLVKYNKYPIDVLTIQRKTKAWGSNNPSHHPMSVRCNKDTKTVELWFNMGAISHRPSFAPSIAYLDKVHEFMTRADVVKHIAKYKR